MKRLAKHLKEKNERRKKWKSWKKQDYHNQISFAYGLNFYKIFLIFILCSIIGYMIEMGWCYLYHGFFESRKSLLFGPFSIIYGIGAVLIIMIANSMHNKGTLVLFWTAAVLGTVFEYLCSYTQEKIFGTVSWDYGESIYSIGGRANLIFSIGWGLIAIFVVKIVLPFFNHFIESIPNNIGLALTWALIIFMSINMFLSAAAVYRQGERREGIAASNSFERFLDDRFPDDYLDTIYVNMRIAGTTLERDANGQVIK